MIICSSLVMIFFPVFFSKTVLPLWYSYATFGVLLSSVILSYIYNYDSVILTADQKDYKIQICNRLPYIIKNVSQIILLPLFCNGYVVWLVLEVLFSLIIAISLKKSVKNSYPYLKSIHCSKEIRNKYSSIVIKIKQIFFHKIGAFALTQTSPLIIYGFTTLTTVALYGNYMVVINGIGLLLKSVFNSITAGVGNLVAEGDKQRIFAVFRELFTFRFFCVSIASICFYYLINPFISIWLGREYVFENEIVFIIALVFFVDNLRSVVDTYINAYGMFWDVWSPVAEAFINISMSILLGCFLGLSGILVGTLLSLLLVIHIWKPFFLFQYGLHLSIFTYISLLLKHLLCLVSTIVSFELFNSIVNGLNNSTISGFIIYMLVVVLFNGIVLYTMLLLLENSMRRFTRRILLLITK